MKQADTQKSTPAGAQQSSAYTPLQRVFAVLALLIIAGLLIALIGLLLTGAAPEKILAVLFCLIVIPCVLYGCQLYVRYTVQKREDQST